MKNCATCPERVELHPEYANLEWSKLSCLKCQGTRDEPDRRTALLSSDFLDRLPPANADGEYSLIDMLKDCQDDHLTAQPNKRDRQVEMLYSVLRTVCISKADRAIVGFVIDHPKARQTEIADGTGLSVRHVRRRLAQMYHSF